jgi:hypothetical protein
MCQLTVCHNYTYITFITQTIAALGAAVVQQIVFMLYCRCYRIATVAVESMVCLVCIPPSACCLVIAGNCKTAVITLAVVISVHVELTVVFAAAYATNLFVTCRTYEILWFAICHFLNVCYTLSAFVTIAVYVWRVILLFPVFC